MTIANTERKKSGSSALETTFAVPYFCLEKLID